MALNINGTTGISGVDGSASAPALQGVDSNTGVSFGTDIVNVVTGGTTRTTVDSSGNFGIGTTSPSSFSAFARNLVVATSTNTGLSLSGNDSSSNYTGLHFCGGSTVRGFLEQQLGSTGTMTINNLANGNISFKTNNAERMKITAGGNAEITNLCVAGAGFSQFDNAQSLISQSSVGSSTQTYFIGNAAIQTSSDRRLKENIVDTKIDASSELKKVRVVDFIWNDPNDKAINNRNSRGKWTGCIAQEIVDVFPFAVNAPRPEGEEIDHDSEALWGMEYGQLVPVLIKGFQELQAKIETLETEKAKMQTDLTALTARVTALEAA